MNSQPLSEMPLLQFPQPTAIDACMPLSSPNVSYSLNTISNEALLNSTFYFSHTYETYPCFHLPYLHQSETDVVCSAITAVVTALEDFMEQLGEALVNFGKALVGAFNKAINAVKEAVEKVVEILMAWTASIINYLLEIMSKSADKYYEATKDWYEGSPTVTGSAFDWSFIDYFGVYGQIRMFLSIFSEVSGVELYYELWRFPRYEQKGPTCAYYTLMEIANYFGKNHDLEDIKILSGDTDTSDGMWISAIKKYLQNAGIYERRITCSNCVSFNDLKQEIHNEEDPIVYTAKNYYRPNSNFAHTVAIVGYFNFAGNEYAMVVDTNYPYFSPYPQRWDFIIDHFVLMDFTEG